MTQKTIKNLKKSNFCNYPKCKKKATTHVMLPVGVIANNGQIIVPDNSSESFTPFCEYHAILAEKGIIQLVNSNGVIILVAPSDVISLVEAVIEAKQVQEMEK